MKLESKSIRSTKSIAHILAQILKGGDVVGLTGDLGVGKSTFVSAIVASLHGVDYSNSPTFVIVQQYDSSSPVIIHIDLYRIESERSLSELGIEELLYNNNAVTLIEWFPRLGNFTPKEYLEISIKCNIGGEREFNFNGVGRRGEEILEALSKYEISSFSARSNLPSSPASIAFSPQPKAWGEGISSCQLPKLEGSR